MKSAKVMPVFVFTPVFVFVFVFLFVFSKQAALQLAGHKAGAKQSSGGKRRVSPPQKMRGKLIENIFLGLNLFPQLGLIWISFRSVVCGIIGFLNEQLCCLTSCICFS